MKKFVRNNKLGVNLVLALGLFPCVDKASLLISANISEDWLVLVYAILFIVIVIFFLLLNVAIGKEVR